MPSHDVDDEPHVFAIPDFWHSSQLLEQNAQSKGSSLFFDSDLQFHERSVSCSVGRPFALDPIVPEDRGFFRRPILESVEQDSGKGGKNEPEPEPEVLRDAEDEPRRDMSMSPCSQLWDETQKPSRRKIGFSSWGSFHSGAFADHQPTLISESGPVAYDALLHLTTDCDVPLVQTRTYFSCLSALAVGRNSVLFTKDDKKQTFRPSLPVMRISGYSRQVLEGVQDQALCCGKHVLRLRAFAQSAYARSSGRCEVALASSIFQVLQAVERKLTSDGLRPCSLLQLQASIREASATLDPLIKLVSRLPRGCSDEDLVSLVFDTASAVDDDQDFTRATMREILRRVSAPWIDSLEEWIGTGPDKGSFPTKHDKGEKKGFIKVEAEEDQDGFGFRLDYTKVPGFMPNDLMEMIFEAGRNLRFIRRFHPHHPLARQNVIESACPPKAEWLYDWQSILELESRVSQYRDNLRHALREGGCSAEPSVEADVPSTGNFFSLDQDGMRESKERLNQAMAEPWPRDSLDEILHERFFNRPRGVDVDEAAITPHWSLLPTLSFGSIVSAQAEALNRECLRFLFDTHDIRGHLRLQRDFHMLGNGVFCSRLSSALFDPDLESAERRAGVARQGGVMGLRLGGRDTWPPASSELRLVLIGVLSESYRSQQYGANMDRHDPLPGDLSFSVRELSAEEIEKCMNTDSVEALDFLRLSYATPAALTGIITPANLQRYDDIFRLLLRVLRVLFVVNQQWRCAGNEPSRFAREAHHFVSSLASYLLDTGVAVPWKALERRLVQMRTDVDDESTTKPQGPDQLGEAHSQALERITSALFLGERQKSALKLLERLLGTALTHAKLTRLRVLGEGEGEGDDEASLHSDFRDRMREFVMACRGLSEEGGGRGEDELVGQLLVKLDAGRRALTRFTSADHHLQIDVKASSKHGSSQHCSQEPLLDGRAGEIGAVHYSHASRIVTTSILPVVEKYGEHSRAVWEASKFWKQFFEASANVSLSGYEELVEDESTAPREDETTVTDDSRDDTVVDYTARTPDADQSTLHSMLDDGDVTGSTPRPPATKTIPVQLSNLESPYEAMRREMKEEEAGDVHEMEEEEDSSVIFAQHTARLPDMSMAPRGSHDGEKSVQRHRDPLLHRVLDKNYRLQATPHKPPYRISPLKRADDGKTTTQAWQDSPMSSPEMAVPTLRSEAFMSPLKTNARQRLAAAARGPRTPGLSVQTPVAAASRDALADQRRPQYEIDWESDGEGDDEDLYAGMSPPKTIQFALPPSKLLQTPAREASRRIVGDILLDAGADPASSEYSPTMVKMNEDILDDSF
ncbi:hypothetical protein CP532_5275 [Ophiocordyceps camponoti-leonardi (nom. inval.)]|nr:hypothetical protein CP532_5275 [Ophiocordyceps camponoti-leonardi (nom. inval.)]